MPLKVTFIYKDKDKEPSPLQALYVRLTKMNCFDVARANEFDLGKYVNPEEGHFHFADIKACTNLEAFAEKVIADEAGPWNLRIYDFNPEHSEGAADGAVASQNPGEELSKARILFRIKKSGKELADESAELLQQFIGAHLKKFHCELLRDYVLRKWRPYLDPQSILDEPPPSDAEMEEAARIAKQEAAKIAKHLERDPVEGDPLELPCRALRAMARDLGVRIEDSYESIRRLRIDPAETKEDADIEASQDAAAWDTPPDTLRHVRLAAVFERIARASVWKELIKTNEDPRDPAWRDPFAMLGLASPGPGCYVWADETLIEVALLKLFSWALGKGAAKTNAATMGERGHPGERSQDGGTCEARLTLSAGSELAKELPIETRPVPVEVAKAGLADFYLRDFRKDDEAVLRSLWYLSKNVPESFAKVRVTTPAESVNGMRDIAIRFSCAAQAAAS